MSRIFDALQRTGQGPVMDEPVLERTETDSAFDWAPDPPIPEAPEPAVADLDAVLAPVHTGDFGATTRTVTLRLAASDPLLPFDSRSRRSVEQYRLIRTKISHHPLNPKIVVITSAGSGDGKTVTSINIAGAMSLKAGGRVLLVDGDLRRSSVARMLGLPSEPGLTDVMTQKCTLDDALVRLEQFPNCFVLPAGTRSENPPELLDSVHWRTLCQVFRERFQHVILDTPPVASVADYELLEAAADGVVMLVRPDHTRRSAFRKAVAMIPPAKLIGLVLNDVKDWFLWTAQGGYSYAYYDAMEPLPVRSKHE